MRAPRLYFVVGRKRGAWAQFGSLGPASGGSTQATQVPLSGRTGQSGSVSAAETPIPGTTSSVNTLNTTVQAQGPCGESGGRGAA